MLKMTDLDLSGKRVLIRADLNVPLLNGEITSSTRIQAILPTLKIALAQNAAIILMSHLGRPTAGHIDPNFSLKPVATFLEKYLGQPVELVSSLEQVNVKQGQVVLLENVRFYKGEKDNDPNLAQRLASICDVFVMDAFATAHRAEASTYGVAQYAPIACAGPLLVSEIDALDKVMQNPKRPLVAVVGGAKVSTKLMVLKNILSQVDTLIPGGGIANTFLAAQGYPVGKSLYEESLIPEAQAMLQYAQSHNKTIFLPKDVVVANEFSPEAPALSKDIEDVAANEMILDVGKKSIDQITKIISESGTILWNGPLGVFEFDQFGHGTQSLAMAIANSSAFSVAGGGDTLAAIEKYQVSKDISYISTGGGAFLEFLEGKTLPAIAILENTASIKA